MSLTDTQLPMFVRLMELFIAMYYGYLDIPSSTESVPPLSAAVVEKASDTDVASSGEERK